MGFGMGMGQSGGLAVPGGLLGGMPIYILKKITYAGNHPGERNGAGARCPLCPHLAPRSESSQGQRNPIPAPGAALGSGGCQEQPGKAQHRLQPWLAGGLAAGPRCRRAGRAVLCCSVLLPGSGSSGTGCPCLRALLAGSRSRLAPAPRSLQEGWWPWVAGRGPPGGRSCPCRAQLCGPGGEGAGRGDVHGAGLGC